MSIFSRSNRGLFSKWWWTVDRYVLFLFLILQIVGLFVVIFSIPTAEMHLGGNISCFPPGLIVSFLCEILIAFAISLIGIDYLRKFVFFGFISTVLLVVAVCFKFQVTGADVGTIEISNFIRIKPVEFLKPFFAVFAAWLVCSFNKSLNAYIAMMGVYFLMVIILMIHPDFSNIAIMAVIWVSQIFVLGVPLLACFMAAVIPLFSGLLLYLIIPSIQKNVSIFIMDNQDRVFNFRQILSHFNEGNIFNKKLVNHSEGCDMAFCYNDFIFSVMLQEFGILFCFIIIISFFLFIARGVVLSFRNKDTLFISISIVGLIVQLLVQFTINMGVGLNLIQQMGIPLPFFSYDFSSSVSMGLIVGMLLSLTKKRFTGIIKYELDSSLCTLDK